jgi:chromosome partitioning protein
MTIGNLLRGYSEIFEYVVIDSPPSLNLITTNAIRAADSLLIPLQCEFYALEGLWQLLHFIEELKAGYRSGLKIGGILLTMFDPGERVSQQIVTAARRHFRSILLRTVIPRTMELRESAGFGRPLLLQNLASLGARRYLQLAKEFMQRRAAAEGQD